MKRIRPVLGILLAVLMLLGCMPTALAKGVIGSAGEEQTRDDYYWLPSGGTYAEKRLTEAAAPEDASHPVELIRHSWYSWLYEFNSEVNRMVASAEIVPMNNSGTTVQAQMQATETVNLSKLPYISFRARVKGPSTTLTVTAKNLSTGYTKQLVSVTGASSWRWYGAVYSEPGVTGEAELEITFTYTYTVGSQTGSNVPACYLTDLRIGCARYISEAARSGSFSYDFEYEGGDDWSIYSVMDYGRNGPYVAMNVNSDPQSQEDAFIELRTTVSGRAGDVLSFNYAATLDYMDGAYFAFGKIENGYHDVIFECDENGGGQFEDDEYDVVSEWEDESYTLPATGTYTFYWRLDAESDASIVAIDNVDLQPAMTFKRALCGSHNDPMVTFTGAADWLPYAANDQLCARSGVISHSQTSAMITREYYVDSGALIWFNYMVSSESNFDKLKVYCVNTVTEAETMILEVSGQSSAWNVCSYVIPQRGAYTFRFEYVKDSSVSRYDDCAYVKDLTVEEIELDAVLGMDLEEIGMVANYGDFSFTPAMLDGEMVLASNNRGVNQYDARLGIIDDFLGGKVISFEYKMSCLEDDDALVIALYESSGDLLCYKNIRYEDDDWHEFRYYISHDGGYEIYITYDKNLNMHYREDTVWLRNFRLKDLEDLNDALNPDNGSSLNFVHEVVDSDRVFDVVEIDGRLAAYAEGPGNAAFIAEDVSIVYGDYLSFDYKVIGEAELDIVIDGVTFANAFGDGSGSWLGFNARLPHAGTHDIRFNANMDDGDAIYIDNVSVASTQIDLDEAVNRADTDVWAYPTATGFIGISDPNNTSTKKYARAAEIDQAEISWTIDAYGGEQFRIAFCFLNEDNDPYGAELTFYIDGEEYYSIDDYFIYDYVGEVQRWFYLTGFGLYHEGQYTVTVEYNSPYLVEGTGACIGSFCCEAVGVSLDEALNVEGGELHFTVPIENDAVFIPATDDGERFYAEPHFDSTGQPHVEMEYSFEDDEDLTGFATDDADGDGYGFIIRSYSQLGLSDQGTGAKAAYSKYYTDRLSDNWLITPAITIPEGSYYPSVSFVYMALADCPEDIEVWVTTATANIENNGTCLFTDRITDTDWHNIGISLSHYAGQTIRVAIRHKATSADSLGVIVDLLNLDAPMGYYSTFSFEATVNQGDSICFDAMAVLNDPEGDLENNCLLSIYEDGTNVFNADLFSLWNLYGGDWHNYGFLAASSGKHVYKFILNIDPETGADGYFAIDNVDVQSTYVPPVLIELIDLDGYTLPDSLTGLPYNGGLYTPDDSYYVHDVVWCEATLTAEIPATEFVAGQSYYAKIILRHEEGYEFSTRLDLDFENDDGVMIVWNNETEVVIRTSVFVCAAGTAQTLPGDVDGNGIVDMSDVSLLFSYLNGGNVTLSEQGLANADANGDGTVNVMDITAIFNIIANS